jgi:hypothetical protein
VAFRFENLCPNPLGITDGPFLGTNGAITQSIDEVTFDHMSERARSHKSTSEYRTGKGRREQRRTLRTKPKPLVSAKTIQIAIGEET